MNSGHLFPQPLIYKNNEVFKREDEILGNSFTLISKNKISIGKQDKKFLQDIGCTFVTLDEHYISQNLWVKKVLELGEVFLIRPDKYIFGCSSNKVSLEQLIDDLRKRI